ncbi:MAG: pyridoxamine 5'-phosphate oxidase family protein [Anaerolineales bacterium]|tara:strand:- start:3402 stop:3800 length:399 start_codon:yes stop_codon:yes gene_type:complete
MASAIPEKYQDLLSWDKKAFANLALSLKDGTPHVTPLWFDYDGEYIVLNSARNRVKDRVMRRSGLVAMAISDPENPYRYIQIRGRIVEITEDGAREMIDYLSLKYTGGPYDGYKGEIRVTYKFVPKFISSMG